MDAQRQRAVGLSNCLERIQKFLADRNCQARKSSAPMLNSFPGAKAGFDEFVRKMRHLLDPRESD